MSQHPSIVILTGAGISAESGLPTFRDANGLTGPQLPVFGQVINNSGFSDSAIWYVFGIGLLLNVYSLVGYDASAHMSEETRGASRATALGMVWAVGASVVFGFVLLVTVTFAVADVQGTLDAGG